MLSSIDMNKETWYFIKQESETKGMIYFRPQKKCKDRVSLEDLQNRLGA